MKKVAFTIVTKNYIGLAKTLKNSLYRYNKDVDFFIFIADDFDETTKINLEDQGGNFLISKNVLPIDENTWDELSFKYNLVEFCTALKPFCFKYLMDFLGYGKVIYFDPDILVYNSLDSIYEKLDTSVMLLTPHILYMEEDFTGDVPDYLFLKYGTFNLGFIGLRKSEKITSVLNWWAKRLVKYSFFDDERGLATDQKWAAFFPIFLSSEELEISADLGLNIAPWNFHERKIVNIGDTLYVIPRAEKNKEKFELVFMHFSSYKQNEIQNGLYKELKYDDLKIAFDVYKDALNNENIQDFWGLSYSYQYFNNGQLISDFNRRVYRKCLDTNYFSSKNNPFETSENSFYHLLKKNKLLTKHIVNFNSGHVGRNSIANANKKNKRLIIMQLMSKFLLTMLGVDRFSFFVKNAAKYFTFENQAHLIDKKIN
ncbi:hypothetical protein SAMN05192574_101560 [Mucilaginibacter gossypiicola]|uniref:Glycosyl transferase family 8 n=1 Tax=Mucilaginibacter gossypiicola TaxID=551995 RepID=A0A1H8ANE5_9SPHI|nr:hypothetical protein [Mucilaginibacter gossypiicola]SEM71289.1 hypothetical protein SAMN05192574_101560 [Mucilaginibacter gossypiicola]